MLFNFLVVAFLSVSALCVEDTSDPFTDLAEHVRSLDEFDYEWKHECRIENGEACALTEFPKDETTMVYPGGESRCMSGEFAFQIVPGASDKVLFYFQGGGACWDETSTKLHLCRMRATPLGALGVFNRKQLKNKFRDHTIVHALYCSGDVHGGNVVRPYNDRSGNPVVQKGLANAQAVLDWTKQQQSTGALASTLSELVIMGCSAGSIGAQLWGKQVLGELKWNKAAVVPDSYAGIFPAGSTGPLMYEFGFCTSGFLSPALLAKCNAQELTFEDVDLEFMAATPNVPYTFIQSKIDWIQRSFFRSIAFTGNYTDNQMSPDIFYGDITTLFSSYNTHLSNFMVYLVDGHNHCYTPRETFFTTDAVSPYDNGKGTDGIMLHDYIAKLPLAEGKSTSSVCQGPVQGVQGADRLPGNETNYYCSSNIVPKTFIEHY